MLSEEKDKKQVINMGIKNWIDNEKKELKDIYGVWFVANRDHGLTS